LSSEKAKEAVAEITTAVSKWKKQKNKKGKKLDFGLFEVVKPYGWFVVGIIVLTVISSGLNLAIPKIISGAIDNYGKGGFDLRMLAIQFSLVSFLFLFSLICKG